MKDFIRNMDSLGRVVIPIELCRAHGMEKNEPVAFVNTPDGVLIRSARSKCEFCGSTEHLTPVKGRAMCENCIQEALLNATVTPDIGKAAM